MKCLLTAASIILIAFNGYSQISEGGYPSTFEKRVLGVKPSNIGVDYQVIELSKPNLELINLEDNDASIKGEPYRVSILHPVSLDMTNSGSWKTLSNGDKIWQLGIKMEDAKALSLYFSEEVYIPKGGKLFAYNSNHSQYVGAFTANVPVFQTMEMIEGELITLEYLMPYGSTVLPVIKISNVAYYYRGVEDRVSVFKNAEPVYQTKAASCQVDVACSEINGWQSQRDAVVHYSFVVGLNGYVCSASVINNTANNCKPYILTANHCGEPTSNSSITNHTWYFNYQRPTCSVGNTNQYTGARSQTMSGGTLKASSQLGTAPSSSTITGADFALIELNSSIPTSYNPYFAGWSRATSAATSGVGIHHPAGHEKKISTYNSALSSVTYSTGWTDAHWRVYWSATTNGHGVTEGGSSGSPLFNQNGLIIGHLTGGASFCTATSNPDSYGKFIKAWDGEGSNTNQRLKPWLDPTNSGVLTLTGTYSPCTTGGGGGTTCTATSTNACTTDNEYIERVQLNTINKVTGCGTYSDYSTTSTTLTKGQSYALTVTPNILNNTSTAYENDQIAAWIDWNNDGDFTDAGEQIGNVLVATGWSNIFNFTVPNTAVNGSLKMRVRLSYLPDDGAISPCGTTDWGEVEDYTVVVSSGGSTNGINEFDLNNILIYPNPTSNNVTVEFNNKEESILSIELRDLTGRLIESQNSSKNKTIFNLVNEASGIYVITLQTNLATTKHKIIKF